jgi:aminoglycoside 6-adenylyltransferase
MDQLFSHQPEDVIHRLIQWAESQHAIRAILMTSTRAVPNAVVDLFSDYDIVLVVEDIHPFHQHRAWIEDFGEVLVTYWDPIYPDPEHGSPKFGNVIQYTDGLKIDFTLWSVELLQKIVEAPVLQAELDAGYRILLDKDRLTAGLKSPTHKAYLPTPPDKETYQRTIEEFLSDAPYVAKCLRRGELLPVKWALDYDMKHVYLRQMLEWKMGLDYDWSVPVGALGKGLKKRLPPDLWSQLEETYVGGDLSENWEALFRTMALYRRVAIEVGERLGYQYPLELDERVIAYVQKMKLA